MDKMVCKEKATLLEAYQHVTKKYSDALTELHREMGTLSKTKYDSLYRRTEMLHSQVAQAQSEFNSHVEAYNC